MGSAKSAPLRLFLDSGVLLEGLFSPWSASHAVLIVARCGASKVVLAEYVRREVERNLLDLLAANASLATDTIDAYSSSSDSYGRRWSGSRRRRKSPSIATSSATSPMSQCS